MAQEIAIQQTGSAALTCATPFSLTSLTALIPDWVSRGLFEDSDYDLPQVIPSDGPKQLRDAARRFHESLQDRARRTYIETIMHEGKPKKIYDDPLDIILGELRLRTATRNESADEQRARFRLLRDDCRNHAPDVVREACMSYAKKNKFFPVGYGELLPFITLAEYDRSYTMSRLRKAADLAEKELADRKRLADDPVDPAEVTALLEEMKAKAGVRSEENKVRDYSNLKPPSPEELAAIADEFKGNAGASAA